MNQTIPTSLDSNWYQNLLNDLHTIFVKHEFTARWAVVEGYHLVGKRILEDFDKFKDIPNGEIVQRVAEGIGKKKSTIWYAIHFAKKYPSLDLLPEGKNTSWHAICNKYLPEPAEAPALEAVTQQVKADFDLVELAMNSSVTLQEELQKLDDMKFDVADDAKGYLLSQLRITASKLNRFLITYDLSR